MSRSSTSLKKAAKHETRNAKSRRGDMLFNSILAFPGQPSSTPRKSSPNSSKNPPKSPSKSTSPATPIRPKARAILRDWHQHQGKKLLRKMLSQHAPPTSRSPAPALTKQPNLFSFHRSSFIVQRFSFARAQTKKSLNSNKSPPGQPCSTLTAKPDPPPRGGAGQRHAPSPSSRHRGLQGSDGHRRGGIKLSEVNPRTYESKICKNLFLTGEVLDLTGPSSGYNLQLKASSRRVTSQAL